MFLLPYGFISFHIPSQEQKQVCPSFSFCFCIFCCLLSKRRRTLHSYQLVILKPTTASLLRILQAYHSIRHVYQSVNELSFRTKAGSIMTCFPDVNTKILYHKLAQLDSTIRIMAFSNILRHRFSVNEAKFVIRKHMER